MNRSWPDLGGQKEVRDVADSSGHWTVQQKALRASLPRQLEFGKKESMGDQSGTVGRGQVMQDLVGQGRCGLSQVLKLS